MIDFLVPNEIWQGGLVWTGIFLVAMGIGALWGWYGGRK